MKNTVKTCDHKSVIVMSSIFFLFVVLVLSALRFAMSPSLEISWMWTILGLAWLAFVCFGLATRAVMNKEHAAFANGEQQAP